MIRNPQNKSFSMRVSQEFNERLKEAAIKAGERTVAGFVKRIMIREAKKYRVKIKR